MPATPARWTRQLAEAATAKSAADGRSEPAQGISHAGHVVAGQPSPLCPACQRIVGNGLTDAVFGAVA